MKPATVDMLRAHLMTAAMAAICIDVLVVLALLLFGIPDQAFQSAWFRWLAVGVIACAVVTTRSLACREFGRAVASRHATYRSPRSSVVWLASDCPRRRLVVLHLRFSRIPFVSVDRKPRRL